MAVQSTMVELGVEAPDFTLPTPDGRKVALRDYDGAPALLVMFISNHCPFVQHVRDELARLGRDYQARGVGVVAIGANDATRYPADGPEGIAQEVEAAGYTFPYLYDAEQDVARAYGAACTPDLFVFDARRRLVYRGQLDDSRPGTDVPVTGRDLRAALDAVLEGRPVPEDQRPSMGCSIKWREDGG